MSDELCKLLERRVAVVPITRRGRLISRIERTGFEIEPTESAMVYVAHAHYRVLRTIRVPERVRVYLDGRPTRETHSTWIDPRVIAGQRALRQGDLFTCSQPFTLHLPEED